jgi:hypothetical protein
MSSVLNLTIVVLVSRSSLWVRARLPSLLGQAGAGRLILYNKAEAALVLQINAQLSCSGVKGAKNKNKKQ